MSLEAMVWALVDAPDVPPECVSLLIGLANHADVRGRGAWAGQILLAEYARKTDRSVRNDLTKLAERGLIRRGDQTLVAHIPADSRPVVYDLALDRKQVSARKHSSARQGTSARQLASAATSDRFTEPQAADQEEREGTGSVFPPGTSLPGGNEEQRERKPASYKPTTNQNHDSPTESHKGGVGGAAPITLFGEEAPKPPAKARQPRRTRPEPHPRFAEWWRAYPNRVDRGDAETAYAEAVAAGADPDDLLASAIRYQDDPKVKNGYAKGPARWLHAKCWLDEPAPPPGAPASNGHQSYRNTIDQSAYDTEELRPS